MIYADLPPEERDRLLAAFDAGFSTGSGCGRQLPGDPELDVMMDDLLQDWFASREIPPAPPEWLRIYAERRDLETAPLRGTQ